jgi:hypothetical protein
MIYDRDLLYVDDKMKDERFMINIYCMLMIRFMTKIYCMMKDERCKMNDGR